MLLGSGMAESYWAEAAKTFTYVSNITPRKKLNYLTPWGVFTNKPLPALSKFYFGEKVLFWLDAKKHTGKLDTPCGKDLYLGPAMDATTYSLPGAHRVWDVDKRQVDRFSDIVSANPLGVPSTLDLMIFPQQQWTNQILPPRR